MTIKPDLYTDVQRLDDRNRELVQGTTAGGGAIDANLDAALSSLVRRQGIVNTPGDGKIERIDANTVRVHPGSAWIDSGGLFGVQKSKYLVSWPHQTLEIPESVVNPRVDRVIVQLTGRHGSQPIITSIPGEERAGVTHDNMLGNNTGIRGALELATIIVGTAGISSTVSTTSGIRDIRTRANGVVAEPLFKSNPTYWVDYSSFVPDGTGVNWTRIEVVRDTSNMCNFRGLFKSAAAWNGGVAATYNNLFQIPEGFRPSHLHMGLTWMYDSAGQKMLIRTDIVPDTGVVRFSGGSNESIGTSNGNQGYAAFQFPSWEAWQ